MWISIRQMNLALDLKLHLMTGMNERHNLRK